MNIDSFEKKKLVGKTEKLFQVSAFWRLFACYRRRASTIGE